ncbi:hypothetical protein [Crocosphaera sp. Alani8]|uniref:hypothetical protein n=1 Tax=Crocosphaera sp. Alani8 TaxID=3038952 RepID=UPI00313F396D
MSLPCYLSLFVSDNPNFWAIASLSMLSPGYGGGGDKDKIDFILGALSVAGL